MARIRSLKPEWRTDEKLKAASDEARVLSASLITLADDYGNGEAGDLTIAGSVWGASQNPREALAKASRAMRELVEIGYVQVYLVEGQAFFHLENWGRHQRVDKPGKPLYPGPDRADEILARSSQNPREVLAPEREREREREREEGEGAGTSLARRVTPAPEAATLARSLVSAIAGRQPASLPARKPEQCAARWAVDIDRLHRLDGRSWDRIREVMDWSQASSFWQSNILSGKKLREKFDMLEAQMSQPTAKFKLGVSGLSARAIWEMSEGEGEDA